MNDNLALKQRFFATLNEKQKRHFAAIEANELGYHGVTVVSKLYNLHPHTIRQGQKELLNKKDLTDKQIRKSGGGRKKT